MQGHIEKINSLGFMFKIIRHLKHTSIFFLIFPFNTFEQKYLVLSIIFFKLIFVGILPFFKFRFLII